MQISYEKILNKLVANKLFDGRIFAVVEKSYLLWSKNFIITTNGDYLVLTPFRIKNTPNLNGVEQIYKPEIESFEYSDNMLTMRKLKIKLKNGKNLSFITRDTEIKQRAQLLNRWLQV